MPWLARKPDCVQLDYKSAQDRAKLLEHMPETRPPLWQRTIPGVIGPKNAANAGLLPRD
jgi:hypothetical protein